MAWRFVIKNVKLVVREQTFSIRQNRVISRIGGYVQNVVSAFRSLLTVNFQFYIPVRIQNLFLGLLCFNGKLNDFG